MPHSRSTLLPPPAKIRRHRARAARDALSRGLIFLTLFVYAAWVVFPMVWVAYSSLKADNAIFRDTFALPASGEWHTENYVHAWREARFGDYFFNSVLVTAASVMPVEKLPVASWHTALGLGFVSAVFDNIPLTALALKQGGYDWGFLAYAVGFGGSMVWFGSSAGVALSNMYPEAKSVGLWLRKGWPIALAYVIGFFVMLAVLGWHPDSPH